MLYNLGRVHKETTIVQVKKKHKNQQATITTDFCWGSDSCYDLFACTYYTF